MKLEIRIEGEVADLVPNSNYEWELYNPQLQLDGIISSKGSNIVLAATPQNLLIIDYINHPNNRGKKVMYKVDKYIGGNLIESGYGYPSPSTSLGERSGGMGLDYTPNLESFFGVYQLLKLNAIDLGTVTVTDWNSTLTNDWENGGMVLPTVKNSAYYAKDAPSGWNGLMNGSTGSPTAYDAISPKVPCFFLKYVMKKVGDMAGVKFIGSWWDDVRTDKLVVFNTTSASLGDLPIRNYLPDMTIGEMVMSLRRLFNLSICPDVNSRTLRMDFNEPKLKAAATKDWSDKFPRIKRGKPVNSDGLLLSFDTDSNDGLSKDLFFGSYKNPPAPQVGGSGGEPDSNYVKVNTVVTTLMVDPSTLMPMCEMEGVTDEQSDRGFGFRLLTSTTLGNLASNKYGDAVMNWEGLYDEYWKTEDAFRKNSFYVETEAALDANDIAWVSACFRGSTPLPPSVGGSESAKVHVYGIEYLIEKVIVPTSGRLCLVGLMRV